MAQNTALAHQPLRYAGQYTDGETGPHYNLFRHYDPQTPGPDRVKRWLEPVPVCAEPAGVD
nr:RHS repeat-associated core domain-containing protein [Kosakonia sp. SMBL-WEM22]